MKMGKTDVGKYLQGKSRAFERELFRAVPEKEPREVYGLIRDFLARGGKRFRPELCMLSCEAVGGSRKSAVPAAVAIELFHNFTLIHDDIEDDSEMRRGKPCLHRVYGTPLAINAGDGLFVLLWAALQELRISSGRSLRAHRILSDAFKKVLEGQGIELNWYMKKEWRVSEKDYLRMAGGKTGSLIGAACEVGAFIGGGSEREISELKKFGLEIGIAFQIQDDVLNLVGEEEKYKKEIGGDITEGKRSLMVTKALQVLGGKEKAELVEILASGTRDERSIRRAIRLIEGCGAIGYAKRKSVYYTEKALKRLETLPDSKARRMLAAIAGFFLKREF